MAVDALSAVFIGVGFLAAVAGVCLMYYSVEDQERNDGWFFQDAQRTDENIKRYEAGRILSIGGVITLVAGLIVGSTRRS